MKKILLLFSLPAAVLIVIQLIESCTTNNNHEKAVKSEFQFREKLSDYAFFKSPLNTLQPQTALIKYQLQTALFSDYAVKDRFIYLPANTRAQYQADGVLGFPDSTIIIKNFAYTNPAHRKVMIETRLLVKDPYDSQWKVMNYLWNAEQTDALKHIAGAKVPITLLDEEGKETLTNYYVPNTNDCKRCHTNNSVLSPIGPKARNLNFTISGEPDNQLIHWAKADKLSGLPAIGKVSILPDWRDSVHYSLSQRARAYLDINCAHCHTKGGDAYNSGLFLEYQQSDSLHLGFYKYPVAAGGGAGGLENDILPGDAAHSIMVYRMNSIEPGTAMPELGRSMIHKEGVELVRNWITSMKKK